MKENKHVDLYPNFDLSSSSWAPFLLIFNIHIKFSKTFGERVLSVNQVGSIRHQNSLKRVSFFSYTAIEWNLPERLGPPASSELDRVNKQ